VCVCVCVVVCARMYVISYLSHWRFFYVWVCVCFFVVARNFPAAFPALARTQVG
jgi:hypothetical protein